MKKYYASLALAVVLILVVALPAIADALYSGTIRITNPGAVASDVTANFTLNSDSFIANGYATGNFSDVSIEYNGIPVKFMPGLGAGTSPWIIQVPLIGAGQNIDYTLLAKGATTGDIAYFPGDGGMTIPYDLSLALGSSFSITYNSTWLASVVGGDNIIFDNTAGRTTGGLNVYRGSDNVTADILTRVTTDTAAYRPNAAGDSTQLTPSAGANYACTGDNNDATWVSTTSGAYLSDLYNFPNHTTEVGSINSVTFYFRIKGSIPAAAYAKPYLKIDGTPYAGTEQTRAAGLDWDTKNQVYANSPAGGAWSWSVIDSMQIGIQLKSSDSVNPAYCADVWIVINYELPTVSASVSATGVGVAEHDIEVAVTTDVKEDSHDTGDTAISDFFGANWRAQTFTPTYNYNITDVAIKAYRQGSPGTLTLSIRAVDVVTGKPTGADLAAGSTNATLFTSTSPGLWYTITLSSAYELSAGTPYAIVVRVPSGNAANFLRWRKGGTYAGGQYVESINSGVAWTVYPAEPEFMFRAYGDRLTLYIDSVIEGTAGCIAVPDDGNDIQIGDDDVTPYIGSVAISVNTLPVSSYAWQYEALFTDLTGSNDASAVTFRTNADLEATLISFQPVSEAKLSSFTLAGSLPTLATPSGPEGGMYVEGDYSHIPGAEAVNEMLGVGGVPYSLWWYPFIYFGICIIGFIIYGATQGPVQPGSTSNPFDGSLLTMALVMEALIVVAGIMNPVPLWPAYLFPIPAIAIIISRKHYSWG